ncbi:hypothetical protein BpHYR1_053014 [Brachionus plicatilis]|uniref:Uncharacterized protein n=1 Tax=Brachionus plicatilis TaxID=10195 RepID=A0A3M7SAE9_BRAPC|nr:hypothetical protein BpHYR1_053014 [Brachionus plicatilis]
MDQYVVRSSFLQNPANNTFSKCPKENKQLFSLINFISKLKVAFYYLLAFSRLLILFIIEIFTSQNQKTTDQNTQFTPHF